MLAGIQSLRWHGFRLNNCRNDVEVFENMCLDHSNLDLQLIQHRIGKLENVIPL